MIQKVPDCLCDNIGRVFPVSQYFQFTLLPRVYKAGTAFWLLCTNMPLSCLVCGTKQLPSHYLALPFQSNDPHIISSLKIKQLSH